VAPFGRTAAELRAQILAAQALSEYRGLVRWIGRGADEVVLYEPATVRRATRMVSELEKIACWRDIARLVNRDAPAGREALEYLWDEWCGGEFNTDGSSSPAITSPRGLLHFMPPGAALRLSNRTDDGACTFIDPYDPLQMGVPILAVQRHAVIRSNLVSYRVVLLQRDLTAIRRTLAALGWTLRHGAERDLARLRRSPGGPAQPGP
jgi:hypothetical protein